MANKAGFVTSATGGNQGEGGVYFCGALRPQPSKEGNMANQKSILQTHRGMTQDQAFEAGAASRQAEISVLLLIIQDAEVYMDRINGKLGNETELCLFCHANTHDNHGITHQAYCPILKARKILAQYGKI